MAFCAYCGKQIPDNAKFCDGCGQPVARGPVFNEQSNENQYNNQYTENQHNNQYTENQYNNQYTENQYNDQYNNQYNSQYNNQYNNQGYGVYTPPEQKYAAPVVGRIKETGGSTLQLILIVCMAVTIIMSFVTGSSTLPYIGGGMIVVTLLGSIPSILVVVGLLMFYLDCKKGVPIGKGLGLYKAAKIITIVYCAIIAVVLIIAMLFGGAAIGGLFGGYGGLFQQILYEAGLDSSMYGAAAGVLAGVAIFLLIVVLVILFLAILFEVKLMHSANVVRDSLAAGTRRGTIPVYPVVIQILLAVFVVITMFSTLATVVPYVGYYAPGYAAGTVISQILSVVQAILTVIMLMKIRAAVNQSY